MKNQKGSPREATPKAGEAGQTQVLILAGIVLLIALAGGIFYLGRITLPRQDSSGQAAPKLQNVAISSPPPSPTLSPTTTPDPTANWESFTHTKGAVSFSYPNSWYVQDDSKYGGAPEGTSFGFYIDGTKADPTYGDHTGNETLNVSFSEGSFSLEELKINNKNAIETTVNGKPAIKTNSFIQIITNKGLFHIGFKGEGKSYLDQILSTFRFLD